MIKIGLKIQEIDIRIRDKSCTKNPVVKLSQLLNSLREDMVLKVIANERDVPYKVLELIVKKRGLSLKVLDRKDDEYIVVISKSKTL